MDNDTKEPFIEYRARLDNIEVPVESQLELDIFKSREIPWDCLTETRKKIVYAYMYERLDFNQIAQRFELNNKAKARLEFYYALTALSEYGTMRAFIDEHWEELTYKQQDILCAYYKLKIPMKELAANLEISKQAIQQIIQRVITKFDIKWQVFVRKEGRKVIYNTPELLK